jgi:hypothetical protein
LSPRKNSTRSHTVHLESLDPDGVLPDSLNERQRSLLRVVGVDPITLRRGAAANSMWAEPTSYLHAPSKDTSDQTWEVIGLPDADELHEQISSLAEAELTRNSGSRASSIHPGSRASSNRLSEGSGASVPARYIAPPSTSDFQPRRGRWGPRKKGKKRRGNYRHDRSSVPNVFHRADRYDEYETNIPSFENRGPPSVRHRSILPPSIFAQDSTPHVRARTARFDDDEQSDGPTDEEREQQSQMRLRRSLSRNRRERSKQESDDESSVSNVVEALRTLRNHAKRLGVKEEDLIKVLKSDDSFSTADIETKRSESVRSKNQNKFEANTVGESHVTPEYKELTLGEELLEALNLYRFGVKPRNKILKHVQ